MGLLEWKCTLAGLVFAVATAGAVRAEPAPDDSAVELGTGWNSRLGVPTATTCVVGKNVPPHGRSTWKSTFHSVSDVSDLMRRLEVNAQAKYGSVTGARASGSMELSTSSKVRTEDVVISINYIGSFGFASLMQADSSATGPDIVPNKRALTTAAKDAIRRNTFTAECGDSYVQSIEYLAGLRGVYTLHNVDRAERYKLNVQGGFATGVTEADVKTSMENSLLTNYRNEKIQYVKLGDWPVLNAASASDFIKTAEQIGLATVDTAAPARVTLVPYTPGGVAGYQPQPIDEKDERELMADHFWRLATLWQQVRDLGPTARFEGPITKESMPIIQNEIREDMTALAKVLKTDCGRGECTWPEGVARNDYAYRARLPSFYQMYPGADYLTELEGHYLRARSQREGLEAQGGSDLHINQAKATELGRLSNWENAKQLPSYDETRTDYWINDVIVVRCNGAEIIGDLCPPHLIESALERAAYGARALFKIGLTGQN